MKPELVKKLERNRDELLYLIADLSEGQATQASVTGEWTIKDLVGHIAYWEGVILDHVRECFAEGRPRPVAQDGTNQAINLREATKRKTRPWARIRAEFVNVRAALVDKVQSLSESDLAFQVPSPWWNENLFYSVGQMIERDTLAHCNEHLEEIRHWKQSLGS